MRPRPMPRAIRDYPTRWIPYVAAERGIALSKLLGVGTELTSGGNESDLVRALRESTQQNSSQAGPQLVTKNLAVQPTIKVRPGWPLRIIVHKDMVLRPWAGARSDGRVAYRQIA